MIVFGTDGWRGLIARDFTFSNLDVVALATARYIKKIAVTNPSVVIGYDTRFLSKEFAMETAQVLASQDIIVHLTEKFSSTPQVSYHTKQKGASLGIVITASHNPPAYNGFKIKANFGGPATPEQIALVETELKKVTTVAAKLTLKPFDFYVKNRKIRLFDAKESYLRYIRKKIDLELVRKAGFKVLNDPMYGAGMNTLNNLIPNVDQLHNVFNPSFGNIDHPEPISEQLLEMIDLMKVKHYDIGIATDGDADRLGAFDSEGNFVDSHKIFMIMLKYLYEVKKKRGAVAKTISVTSMVNKYCDKKGIQLFETPVGFKYISKLMITNKIVIGGEESGGLGTILHIPERDGIFNALLLMEIMAVRKKSLKELCEELDEEFGTHRYWRRDVIVTTQQKAAILSACQKDLKKIGRFNVIRTDN
ncbi:MAG: phosphoglucomutase/phosphomannomutase family protein, partial [Bacteroidota bacterium]